VVLYFLLDLPGEKPIEALRAFLPRMRGGWGAFDLIQVRAKQSLAREYVEALRCVREAVGGLGADAESGRGGGGMGSAGASRPAAHALPGPLIIANDRLDVALAAGADGIHVGAGDLPPEAIRRLDLPPGFIVGLTCHTAAELEAAPGRGADYVGVGAFFSSETKRGPLPDPREALRGLGGDYPLPIYAIGGITVESLPEVVRTRGVRGVVVSGAIQRAAQPAAAAIEFRRRLDELSLASTS
jgi:thiamine-phosphate pyrophosphorylase